MPLTIQLPDAADPIRRKYGRYFSEAERIFRFTEEPVDFVSNGIISNDQFTSVLDGDPVVKHFRNMTINTGHTVTPTNRCKGMYLLIEGDLTINGILSMSARGAKAPGKFVGIDPIFETIYFNETDIFSTEGLPTVGKKGGLGINNAAGGHGANGACGAGGANGTHPNFLTTNPAKGADGTSFSGGSGGGGFVQSTTGNKTGNPPEPDGGAGGNGRYVGGDNPGYGGGGAGNPGGAGPSGGVGGTGTGGLLIIMVKGNIIFGPTGQIVSKGSNGGKSRNGVTNVAYMGGGGGASGGGAIHLFTKNPFTAVDKIDISGGLGGTTNWSDTINGYGKNGGNGSLQLYRL